MSAPDWLKNGDPLAARLLRMGWHSQDAFAAVERIAYLVQDQEMTDYDATELVLGYVPMLADEKQTEEQCRR